MLGDDWRWCPCCRSALERSSRGGRLRPTCPACGFVFFAAAGVGAAVVVRDASGRVLLVQRGRGPRVGQWCFPCGWVEWGEDVEAAARREALEEAGVPVVLGKVLQVASNEHDPANPSVGIWYAATLADPAAIPRPGDDARAVGWFALAALPPLAFPTDARLLARLRGAARAKRDPSWSRKRSS